MQIKAAYDDISGFAESVRVALSEQARTSTLAAMSYEEKQAYLAREITRARRERSSLEQAIATGQVTQENYLQLACLQATEKRCVELLGQVQLARGSYDNTQTVVAISKIIESDAGIQSALQTTLTNPSSLLARERQKARAKGEVLQEMALEQLEQNTEDYVQELEDGTAAVSFTQSPKLLPGHVHDRCLELRLDNLAAIRPTAPINAVASSVLTKRD